MTQRPRREHAAASGGTEAMESLYPFLYSGTSDLPAVLDQVRASTVAKARGDPRAAPGGLRARRGPAASAARRTPPPGSPPGGRLLAFGNGGSATDAQQLATLFLNPGPDARAAARLLPGQ